MTYRPGGVPRLATQRARLKHDAGVVASVVIVPDFELVSVGEFRTFTATAFDAQGVPVPGKVFAFDTSTPGVIDLTQTSGTTVDAEALSAGSGQLSATVDGVTGFATMDVALSDIAEMHAVHGDDGTGNVVRAFGDGRSFVTSSGVLTSWEDARGSAFGAGLLLTPAGSSIVPDMVKGTITLNGTNQRLWSQLAVNASGGFTIVLIAAANSGSSNGYFCNLINGARTAYMGLRRNSAGSTDDIGGIMQHQGQGSNVLSSGVVHSGALRIVVISVDAAGIATMEVLNGATDTGPNAVPLPSDTYRLVIGAFSEVATGFVAAEYLAYALIKLPSLTAAQKQFWADYGTERGAQLVAAGGGDPDLIVLTPATLTLTLGNTFDVDAVVSQGGNEMPGASVQYLTDDPAICTISNLGRITPVAGGITVVRARTPLSDGSFLEDTCTVTIAAPVAAHLTVSPLTLNVPVGATRSATVAVRDQSTADGADIGFAMTSGYTLDTVDNPSGIAASSSASLQQVDVLGQSIGGMTVTVDINGGALTADISVDVVPVVATTTFHIADEMPFYGHSIDWRAQSNERPVVSGTLKHFMMTAQTEPMACKPAAPTDALNVLAGNCSHFVGRQAVHIATAAMQICEAGTVPGLQFTCRYAARVTDAQFVARLQPVVYVVNPHTRAILGYLYDPVATATNEGLGNAWAAGDSLVGRECTFTTAPLSGVPRGAVLMIELWAVGTTTYNGYGTPRANGKIGTGNGSTAGDAITDGWTPGITLRRGMAYSQTADESERPDYRQTADVVVDGAGNATLPWDFLPPGTYSSIPDNNQLYPRHGFEIAVGGTITPAEGAVNADPAFTIDIDQEVAAPAPGVACHLDLTSAIRYCAWRAINGPAVDLSGVRVYDVDGVEVSGANPVGLVSGTPAVAAVSGLTLVPGSTVGSTEVTVTAGTLSAKCHVQTMPDAWGANPKTVAPFTAATHVRTFESIATSTQPVPDNQVRGTLGQVGGSQGWDDIERTGVGYVNRGSGRAARISPALGGVLGFDHFAVGLVGVVQPSQIQIDPALADTDPPYRVGNAVGGTAYYPNTVRNRNLRRQIETESRVAMSEPTPDGSAFINRFHGMNGGVGAGTLQSVQSGSTAWLVIQPDHVEAWECLYFDGWFLNNGIVQKGDYVWHRQNRTSVGQIGPNYVPSWYAWQQTESNKQSLNYEHVGLQCGIIGQGHPENDGGPVPGEGFDANGSKLRPSYKCNADGVLPRGRWTRLHYSFQHSSGPGVDDGIFYMGLDHGDGLGERQALFLNDVRTVFTDSTVWYWKYVQRVAVRGGGVNLVLRRKQRLYTADWAWKVTT